MRIIFRLKGGPGSGFEGHHGIPGHQGGSAPDSYTTPSGTKVYRISAGTVLPENLVDKLKDTAKEEGDAVRIIYNTESRNWHIPDIASFDQDAHGDFMTEAMDGETPNYTEEIQARGFYDPKENTILLYDFGEMAEELADGDPIAEKQIKYRLKAVLREAVSNTFYVKNENGRTVKPKIEYASMSEMMGN